jgi:CheY-like chemotaxis protein
VRNLSGLTVLVVDDDEGSLDYFTMALQAAGAAVLPASTAVEALKVLQQARPHVVLTDIAMPGQDGYWLVREIRRLPNPSVRGVPVVATTAYGRVHSRDRALAAGFADHIAKPVEPDVLCGTIARVTGRSA